MPTITDKTGSSTSLTDKTRRLVVLVDDPFYTVNDTRCTVNGDLLEGGGTNFIDQTSSTSVNMVDIVSHDIETHSFFLTSNTKYYQTSNSYYLLAEE